MLKAYLKISLCLPSLCLPQLRCNIMSVTHRALNKTAATETACSLMLSSFVLSLCGVFNGPHTRPASIFVFPPLRLLLIILHINHLQHLSWLPLRWRHLLLTTPPLFLVWALHQTHKTFSFTYWSPKESSYKARPHPCVDELHVSSSLKKWHMARPQNGS